jgi:putative transposase
MPNYRRALVPGASWFFTVNLLQRRNNDLLVRHVDILREAVRRVHRLHPFAINAWVVLPEHMHCVWTLPPGDADYSLRWRLIKTFFCRALPADEHRSVVRLHRGERGIWQRRYWEHLIRDDEDYRRHVDYVYVNPLKHGLVGRVRDWPYSSFHRDVRVGLYPLDWVGDVDLLLPGMDRGFRKS